MYEICLCFEGSNLCLVTGTGKSVTGAHLAYALAMKLKKESVSSCGLVPSGVTTVRGETVEIKERKRCVMYCAPSNQAANVVLGMFELVLLQ